MGLNFAHHFVHFRRVHKAPWRLRMRIGAERRSLHRQQASDFVFLPSLTMHARSLAWRARLHAAAIHANRYHLGNSSAWRFPTMVDVVLGRLLTLSGPVQTDLFQQALHGTAADRQLAQNA